MKAGHVDLVCDALEESGFTACVRSEYSGRGMYGDITMAVVTDATPEAARVAVESYCKTAPQAKEREAEVDRITAWRSDNMGLGYVLY